jgi:hypothetical protein
MSNEQAILTLANTYREELRTATDINSSREKLEWYRDTATPLFTQQKNT